MIATNFRVAEVMIAAIARKSPKTRLMLAGTSKMYSTAPHQTLTVDENTSMDPSTFYGRTKVWSRELLMHFRDAWGVFGSTAILFNHESTLRPPRFVTRKVTMAAARAKRGQLSRIELLDLHAQTDWSSASDIVEGMRLALEADHASDFVFASGVARPITALLDVAFGAVDLSWTDFVDAPSASVARQGTIIGDATRARQCLGWTPRVDFVTMIRDMVRHDLSELSRSGNPASRSA
jgi:GDPmannose 4,6-dehydratase